MDTVWKWFAGVDDAELPPTAGAEDEYSPETPVALPAHVTEFLALKAAADA